MSEIAETRIPQAVEQLDSAWVTGVLRTAGTITTDDSVEVTGTEGVGVGAAFACELHRLTLRGPASAPASIVVKLPVVGEVRAMLDGIGAYGREVLFYREVAPHLPVRTPRIYAALQSETSSDFVLAMEDLAGLEMVEQLTGFSLAQAEAAIDALAGFHRWSWEQPDILERHAANFWPLLSPAGQALQTQYGQLFAHVWAMRRGAFTELLSTTALSLGDRFAELQPQLVERLAAPRCITHGELRSENLCFEPTGAAVFFDFQTAQEECGVRELAYLLCTSVRPELLAAHEDTLIERYVAGIPGYALADGREQYRLATAYNLIWPVMANIRWEGSNQRGRAVLDDMLRNIGAAIDRTGGVPTLWPGSAPGLGTKVRDG
jgi:aminoglycoside phosphotransferase (APT) family kinase protein